MSWLPQDKLTTEEKEKLKELQQRKDSLIGKYHTQIKSQTTTHETWLNIFITDNTKKREFKDRETLPHRYRIKRSRFRENYPSLFDYPNEIPKHHTVDRLVTVEQEELNKRIVKQEQETKTKSKPRKKRVVNKSHHNYQ